ncbi:MAG: nitrate reductase molybdenum cofactor assembly chaperone [Burkholderiales bacterium]|nr:nitrate reductase molybdenum cofactor assembly chaperone [Burkholderiales bacterium]
MSEPHGDLRETYGCIAELWCSPRDVDLDEVKERARRLLGAVAERDSEAAASLARFLQSAIDEEQYVDLFELNPRCPLYLGSHVFDEPKTCAQAGLSDRNGYMIELRGIYGHLGFSPNGKELPDYLPLMVEFLSLSAGSGDPVRGKLAREYVLPYLPPIRAKLKALDSPYAGLLDALERLLKTEFAQEVNHV